MNRALKRLNPPLWLRRILAAAWAPMYGPWCVHGEWMYSHCAACYAMAPDA